MGVYWLKLLLLFWSFFFSHPVVNARMPSFDLAGEGNFLFLKANLLICVSSWCSPGCRGTMLHVFCRVTATDFLPTPTLLPSNTFGYLKQQQPSNISQQAFLFHMFFVHPYNSRLELSACPTFMFSSCAFAFLSLFSNTQVHHPPENFRMKVSKKHLDVPFTVSYSSLPQRAHIWDNSSFLVITLFDFPLLLCLCFFPRILP